MLIFSYIQIYMKELMRNKSAAFFTIVFPSLLVLMFTPQVPKEVDAQWAMFIALANYAVQCAMFQALGMSISFNRSRKWTQYVRLLPASSAYSIIGRVLAMLFFATLSLLLVIIVGSFFFSIEFNMRMISIMALIAIAGGVPMGFFGIYLGQLINAVTARSVFVVVNLLLFFAAFCFPDHGWGGYVKNVIPSAQWLSLSYDLTIKNSINYMCLFGLVGYIFTFYFLAIFSSKNN